jgi:hypothetical protein
VKGGILPDLLPEKPENHQNALTFCFISAYVPLLLKTEQAARFTL